MFSILALSIELFVLIDYTRIHPWEMEFKTDVEAILELTRMSLHFVENFIFLILAFANTQSQYEVLLSFYAIMKQFRVTNVHRLHEL